MDRACHDDYLATFRQDIACPTENKFARWRGINALSSATHKDGESYVVFEGSNLLAYRRLRTVDPLCCSSKVLALINGDKIFEMAKLYGI